MSTKSVRITLLLLLCCLYGMSGRKEAPATTVIKLLPLGKGMDTATAGATYRLLQTFTGNVVLLPAEPLPQTAYTAARKRYRADTLLSWLSRRATTGERYVGITTVDISTTKDKHHDWGVMGLSLRPGNASVASTYRLKNKAAFPLIVLHETGHAFGLPHCPVQTCYMVDAEGGDKTSGMKGFCDNCTRYLQQKGWQF